VSDSVMVAEISADRSLLFTEDYRPGRVRVGRGCVGKDRMMAEQKNPTEFHRARHFFGFENKKRKYVFRISAQVTTLLSQLQRTGATVPDGVGRSKLNPTL
jgi:hypothetical protein